MLVIPALDICNEVVVHAKKGERNLYQPIQTILTDGHDPFALLKAYFNLYPFKNIYIADLNAIQQQGDQIDLIIQLTQKYPASTFWLDAGITFFESTYLQKIPNNIKPVLGSEQKIDKASFIEFSRMYSDYILSLDYNDDGFIENDYLLNSPELWPTRVIVMSLHKVGSDKGIDIELLKQLQLLSDKTEFYAAGGVSDTKDLDQLKDNNINGVLLATALYNGTMGSEEIKYYSD